MKSGFAKRNRLPPFTGAYLLPGLRPEGVVVVVGLDTLSCMKKI